ncbi:MAG: hypothetical protein HY432_01200 [Candidatus Liptonbacteria bacterium]|nr:hypothetical protein [Candidatus Liptonbacteria bacterium]
MRSGKKIYFVSLFLLTALLGFSLPAQSRAEITFRPSPTEEILNNLPSPLSEFIDSAKNLSNAINSGFTKYGDVAPIGEAIDIGKRINQFNLTDLLKNIFENSFITGAYPIFAKMIHFVGSFLAWILDITSQLIKKGLSFL